MFKSALVIFNISKNRNVGALIRTANALGVFEIIVVGRKKISTFGSCGTFDSKMQKHFYSLDEAVKYLRANKYTITGIEINSQSIEIEKHPFKGNTAFLPGNEGTGLSEAQRNVCDQLVYINQYGSGASLNVNVATGIVLHHFSTWAQFKPNPVVSQKFVENSREIS